MKTKYRAAAFIFALLVVSMLGGAVASAAQTIHVKASQIGTSGTTPCAPGRTEPTDEWHFVITQLGEAADAPPSITVEFESAGTVVVPLEKVTGGTAHYTGSRRRTAATRSTRVLPRSVSRSTCARTRSTCLRW